MRNNRQCENYKVNQRAMCTRPTDRLIDSPTTGGHAKGEEEDEVCNLQWVSGTSKGRRAWILSFDRKPVVEEEKATIRYVRGRADCPLFFIQTVGALEGFC